MIAAPINLTVSGIYCVIHRATLKCYIGSSQNITQRRRAHKSDSKTNLTNCFHRALHDLGINEFDFEIIEECEQAKLLERERFWIGFYNSASIDGFNTQREPAATYNYRHTEATKQRMSAFARKKFESPEARKKISLALTGVKFTPERMKTHVNPMKGKKVSESTKAKMSAASKGVPKSPEHRLKMAKLRKGAKLSLEQRKKASEATTEMWRKRKEKNKTNN